MPMNSDFSGLIGFQSNMLILKEYTNGSKKKTKNNISPGSKNPDADNIFL